jgi:ADP-L-glycero-D-manno-heptose 6-epimerase
MIVVTGAAGFIGSCLVEKLNREGKTHLLLVDDFSREDKRANWESKRYSQTVNRDIFPDVFAHHAENIEFIYHLGARTDTTEFDVALLDKLNLDYSKAIFRAAAKHNIPLVYASSAATYGLGEKGYKDNDELAYQLKPLNPYGESKNDFDKWVLEQEQRPENWKGVKFFNVYGPNEFHKGRMASVIFHTYNQVRETGAMKLFRSHNPDFKDGEQLRDFVYVKDVVDVLWYFFQHRETNGLYNLGTGKARSFNDLAKATFKAMGLEPNISYMNTPEDIRDKYQYFTEAEMDKLRDLGYYREFTSLEHGVADYVKKYLIPGKHF